MTICYHCKRSSSLIFNCSCSQKFCIKCRLPETHKCSINYKDLNKSVKIIKNIKSQLEII